MYVCGVTPYAESHAAVNFDVLFSIYLKMPMQRSLMSGNCR
ncbi:hypothetical protein RchiOBHm_Chr5g0002811 [Rosa chinensis]|uniref:Uncharacterized protein n=1 Tax=Rosa chinensis TaxID=74649 RepID=A0A2P6Q2K4_ROSCH|nr:hypothetical protein RchiOBHm_Chr5g0002811 [Rosa chinensis]